MANRYVIIGAGGQARETLATIMENDGSSAAAGTVVGCVVSDVTTLSDLDSKDLVLGDLSWLRENRSSFDFLALGVGSPSARWNLSRNLLPAFPVEFWPPIVHPSAIYDRKSCRISAGAYIGAGVVMTVGVVVERFAMVNFGATIGHESQVGEASVVNPGANISGGVAIGRGVLVGTGSQILQYRSVANEVTVGAGAVVTRDLTQKGTYIGVPARIRN